MHVILLAAGQSSRMDPLSDKNLLPFCGKPLVQHQVERLRTAGLKNIVVVVNTENHEAIANLFRSDSDVELVVQKGQGQAAGVLCGAKKVKGSEVLILCTNDVFEEQLFLDLLRAAEAPVEGVIAGKEMEHYFPGGYLKVDEQDDLTGIVEKPGEGKEPSNLVNLLCHLYKNFPAFLAELQTAQSEADDVYEVALDHYLKKGAKIKVHRYQGVWQALKYPWYILDMMASFLSNQTPFIHPSAEIASTAVLRGKVVLEAGVKVLDHAVVQGPAYVGKNCVIANNALVRQSMLGEGSVAGYNTEIARSYLANNVWTHSNYVGDSIIDSNVSFGAGAVTGNLRHDEAPIKMTVKGERLPTHRVKLGATIGSGSRIGIHASLNPGVKIGRDCFIGGGVLVNRDVQDKTKLILSQSLEKSENIARVDTQERGEIK